MTVRQATKDDLEDLSTLFARSFHPVSPYMRRTFPDTQTMRHWWKQVHKYAILDPEVTLMVVLRNNAIIAMARWRYYPRLPHEPLAVNAIDADADLTNPEGDLSAGTWTLLKSSPDTNTEMYKAMMVFMQEVHIKYMSGKPHYLIELLATAHEAQGTGAGRLLLEELAKRADKQSVETIVETNNLVVEFYEKLGYEIRERKMMPGDLDYEEFALIRAP